MLESTLNVDNEMKLFISKKRDAVDLVVHYCGMQNCVPNQNWTHMLKDHFLIHYILDGCGTFEVNNHTYFLHKNEGFLICPNISSFYKADEQTPWKYAWVGFSGLKAESYIKASNLSIDNPIFQCKNGVINCCFYNMIKACRLKKSSEIRLSGLLHIFLSELIEQNNNNELIEEYPLTDLYLEKSLEYIHKNYSKGITICDIADYLGIDRRYFSSIFKNKFYVSPKEYLTNYQIHKACELCLNQKLSFKEISNYVGYSDPLSFSKVFKKVTGYSPTEYRNSLKMK